MLGFPWTAVIVNGHSQGSLMMTSGVWEAAGGTVTPLLARNVAQLEERVQSVSLEELVTVWRKVFWPTSGFFPLPPLLPLTETLPSTIDRLQAHGLPLQNLLTPQGTGIVWASARAKSLVPGTWATEATWTARSALLQVTNLGISLKDGPASTLVFVTGLDSGLPVSNARISILNSLNTVLWRGTTNADGVALAPSLPLNLSIRIGRRRSS